MNVLTRLRDSTTFYDFKIKKGGSVEPSERSPIRLALRTAPVIASTLRVKAQDRLEGVFKLLQ
jgi:hypothetical protein